MHNEPSRKAIRSGRLFDRQALALISVILFTEAAIAVIFFSVVQQYPAYLLHLQGASFASRSHLLRTAAAYAGYALSAYGIAKLPAQPFSGWLVDRFGPRRVLALGLAACVAVVLGMARASSLAGFALACGVYGLTAGVVWPSVYAIVGDIYRPSVRGRMTAAISGAQIAGSAAGFAGGAIIVDQAGFAAAFGAALALNAAALVLGLAGSGGNVHRSMREAEQKATGGRRAAMQSLVDVLTPNLLLLAGILVLVSLSVSLLAPDLKPYSAAELDLPFSTFALLLAIPAVVAALTLILSGRIVDGLGRCTPMIVAAALWPVALLALTLTRALPLVLLLAALAAFAYALGLPAWSASLIDLSTAGRRGLQVGLVSAIQGLGLAAGPAIGGQAVARFGVLAPFDCSAALMLAALALILVYRARVGEVYRAPGRNRIVPS